ncbi:hypothetical protein PV327_003775 [Microctonus hyperodae]|uniref:C2H2-type domain-containing protein n=1 Tax=Microctonus hyperodae TaxID=165561 RepID=A0AA39L1J2_MICHY|nr:hypothetical protein PV327_003775 [Microctonus hyperodae]
MSKVSDIHDAKFKSECQNDSTTHLRTQFFGLEDDSIDTQCLLCDLKFNLPTNEKQFLSHLFKNHRLIIGDVWKIASLQSYVHYWRVKFSEQLLTTFCTTVLMDCTPDGEPSKNEVYYLLSDCISEDKTLRDELRRAKLEFALDQQSQERVDKSFKRGCMFCRLEFSGLRIDYLKHLSMKHNIQLGKLENLVFVDKLLDKIQNNIESLKCIYCEKLFKDRDVLKEHMRKKFHKRINPGNKQYDQFYISNYLEPNNTWRRRERNKIDDTEEHTEITSDNEDEESPWTGWNDDDSVSITCLLCSQKSQDFTAILEHMIAAHNFDFVKMTDKLNFYEKVKVVNYLRQQIEDKKCIYCNENLDDTSDHMMTQNHYKIPPSQIWNQLNFYSPKNNTDSFLYHLDTNSDDEDNCVDEN